MESLIEIAKRLGIKPNPKITEDQYRDIKKRMGQELKKIGFPLPVSSDLANAVYDIHKCSGLAHLYDTVLYASNIKSFKEKSMPGVSVYPQDGFLYHRTSDDNSVERFVASLKMDSPDMPKVFLKLDEFILKHKGAYKISIYDKDWKSTRLPNDTNRTDTINLYMTEPITSQIAKEFYEIVKPVLEEKTHEFLDGFPIQEKGKEIKGIKFGPEPLKNYKREEIRVARKRLESVLPEMMINELGLNDVRSLGQISAMAQLGDFFYYLIGKEGKNPIQLGNQFGDPKKNYFKRIIDITPPTGIRSLLKKKNWFRTKSKQYES